MGFPMDGVHLYPNEFPVAAPRGPSASDRLRMRFAAGRVGATYSLATPASTRNSFDMS